MLFIFGASSCEVWNISCNFGGLRICLQRHEKHPFSCQKLDVLTWVTSQMPSKWNWWKSWNIASHCFWQSQKLNLIPIICNSFNIEYNSCWICLKSYSSDRKLQIAVHQWALMFETELYQCISTFYMIKVSIMATRVTFMHVNHMFHSFKCFYIKVSTTWFHLGNLHSTVVSLGARDWSLSSNLNPILEPEEMSDQEQNLNNCFWT